MLVNGLNMDCCRLLTALKGKTLTVAVLSCCVVADQADMMYLQWRVTCKREKADMDEREVACMLDRCSTSFFSQRQLPKTWNIIDPPISPNSSCFPLLPLRSYISLDSQDDSASIDMDLGKPLQGSSMFGANPNSNKRMSYCLSMTSSWGRLYKSYGPRDMLGGREF